MAPSALMDPEGGGGIRHLRREQKFSDSPAFLSGPKSDLPSMAGALSCWLSKHQIWYSGLSWHPGDDAYFPTEVRTGHSPVGGGTLLTVSVLNTPRSPTWHTNSTIVGAFDWNTKRINSAWRCPISRAALTCGVRSAAFRHTLTRKPGFSEGQIKPTWRQNLHFAQFRRISDRRPKRPPPLWLGFHVREVINDRRNIRFIDWRLI